MATLDQHQSQSRVKILCVGDPKGGKTSALAGLANAGQRLFILDFDDNLAILRHLIKPEFHRNVIFETLRDNVVGSPKGPVVKGMPTAFARATQLLDKWGDYGAVTAFGPDDWLVIDTGTHMGSAAMWYTLYANNRMGKKKRFNDWGSAMERQEGVIQQLTSTEVKCNVLVNFHLSTVNEFDLDDGDDEETGEVGAPAKPAAPRAPLTPQKRYPSALGRKLPPRIASYFDTVVQAKIIGSGPHAKRVIRTVPEADVDIAVPLLPGKLPAELPNSDGLWRITQAIRALPASTPSATTKEAA